MFALDPADVGESQGWFKPVKDRPSAPTPVTVPHTWQVSPGTADYMGVGWYWAEFDAASYWANRCVRIEFEAVFHSAKVWLNGQLMGEHRHSGYTAFSFDISPALRIDRTNSIAVKVDDSFNPDMLPRNDSYDWAQDGGIIRPVNLLVSPKSYVERLWIDAVPDLEAGRTPLTILAVVHNTGQDVEELGFQYRIEDAELGSPVAIVANAGKVRLEPSTTHEVALTSINERMKLWHFDHPHLYRATVEIWQGMRPVHSYTQTFGVRKFEARDTAFYLNGERVWLMGVERMAGSNPQYGMAEPAAWITHDHDDLKELNCVFTRVHWQQDKRVLDYCDRHGILFQEEVPSWGGGTFEGMTNQPSPELMQNGLEQLRQMINRDGNHPCIVSWGLCNEVNGHNPVARAFIERMAAEARRLIPTDC